MAQRGKKCGVTAEMIYADVQNGMNFDEVAAKYGITKMTVRNIIKADKKGNNEEVTLIPKSDILVDPETGTGVYMNAQSNKSIVVRMGDEKVTAFVKYHEDMLLMRIQNSGDKRDVRKLYERFYKYLDYCSEHGIIPNNASCYFTIGVSRQEMSAWRLGKKGTPEHKEFADTVQAFFASVHEQGAMDGVLNPISAMFWQKAYDNLIEASKLEVVQEDPLGEKRSAEDIAKAYTEVELPD